MNHVKYKWTNVVKTEHEENGTQPVVLLSETQLKLWVCSQSSTAQLGKGPLSACEVRTPEASAASTHLSQSSLQEREDIKTLTSQPLSILLMPKKHDMWGKPEIEYRLCACHKDQEIYWPITMPPAFSTAAGRSTAHGAWPSPWASWYWEP